jgi:putative ABC transport system ATP-binding protein
MLTAITLSKAYRGSAGKVAALCDFSATVNCGEFVAVQGPSGCGKSTLLLVCGALLAPDAGRVTVDGADLYALPADARARFRARHIGFVFQQFHLIPYLSVRDNVLAGALATGAPAPAGRAEELIERFGLSSRIRHVPSELSTGERQRVALARALLNQPKLILADEPTGNLDEVSGDIVLAALANYARAGGAVLMVTHDPRATRVAQRVLQMRAGRLT